MLYFLLLLKKGKETFSCLMTESKSYMEVKEKVFQEFRPTFDLPQIIYPLNWPTLMNS